MEQEQLLQAHLSSIRCIRISRFQHSHLSSYPRDHIQLCRQGMDDVEEQEAVRQRAVTCVATIPAQYLIYRMTNETSRNATLDRSI